ncbi:MAG: hypothetical protein E8D43_00455 [Nitrospira sp.]|nr:MAG: hypothetical protein E8D43_00455 [Nitrospira sp.]
MLGGIQIGNGTGAFGTLGCFVKRNAEDDWVSNRRLWLADATGNNGIFLGKLGLSLTSANPVADWPQCAPDKHGDFDTDLGYSHWES